jgi:hypothetical protein
MVGSIYAISVSFVVAWSFLFIRYLVLDLWLALRTTFCFCTMSAMFKPTNQYGLGFRMGKAVFHCF